MEEQKMISVFYTFDGAIPVPEKAKALGLGRYADVAWRNFAIKVKVTFPERAQEYDLIELPERKRGHSGYMQIVMDESLKDSVTFEVTREDVAKLNLLGVQYFPHHEPGKIIAVLELPPPVAVVVQIINPPREVHGQFCTNAAVAVVVNNVVGMSPPPQEGGKFRGRNARRDRPMNYRLHLMNNFWFNYYRNRTEGSDEADTKDTFFWPEMCTLVVRTTGDMLQPTERLVARNEETGEITVRDPALTNAHPNLLQSIADERLSFYKVPETVPQLGWYREFAMTEFHRLVSAWDNRIVSAAVQGEGKFLPHAEAPNDFFCCLGVSDPKGQTQLTDAVFGRLPSIYRMRGGPGGRKSVETDKNGDPKYMPPNSGWAVVLKFRTMFEILAALYGACKNGDMDLFYRRNLLLLRDELFRGDDHETKQRHQKQLKAQQAESGGSRDEKDTEAEEDEEASDPDSEPDAEETDDAPPIEFGDNSDKLGGKLPDLEEEEDDGEEENSA